MAAAATPPPPLPVYPAGDRAVALLLPPAVFEAAAPSGSTAAPSSPPTQLLFLVDSSGSMRFIWPHVAAAVNAITRGREATHVAKWALRGTVRTSPLRPCLEECSAEDGAAGRAVGFGTNITAAATILHTQVEALVAAGATHFVVVLVTDGEGEVNGLTEACAATRVVIDRAGAVMDLTVLGVGSCFPTAVAMDVRAALHTGRPSVPLLTIVQEGAEVGAALDGLAPLWELHSAAVRLEVAQAWPAPWGAPTASLNKGVVYLLPVGTPSVCLCVTPSGASAAVNDPPSVWVDYPLQVTGWEVAPLAAAAKQWSWALQAASLAGAAAAPAGTSGAATVRARAVVALAIVDAAAASIVAAARADGTPSVRQRVARKAVSRGRHTLTALRGELRRLATGVTLEGLSDGQLAKRLAIGTMEGRHHASAVAWKGLDEGTWADRREDFLSRLADPAALAAVRAAVTAEEAAGLRSAVTLEGNAEVLAQPDLSAAIAAVASQYELVEVLPLVGLAVRVVRTNAGMINPWVLPVEGTALHTPTLDTASLLALSAAGPAPPSTDARTSRGVVANLSTGGDATEEVNAVVALVADSPSAAALRPFLTSPLYELLHTYTACGNVDTADRAAHPALLAATATHLITARHAAAASSPAGPGGVAPFADTLAAVLRTLRELYPRFCGYVRALGADPAAAVVTASDSISTSCPGMAKPIALSLAWEASIPDPATRRAIVSAVVREWVGRAMGTHDRTPSGWFALEDPVVRVTTAESGEPISDMDAFVATLDPPVSSYYTLGAAVAAATRKDAPLLTIGVAHGGVRVREGRLRAARDGGVTVATLEGWARELTGDATYAITAGDLAAAAGHALAHTSSLGRRAPTAAAANAARVAAALEREALGDMTATTLTRLAAAVGAAWRASVGAAHAGTGAAIPLSWAAMTAARAGRPHPPPPDMPDGGAGATGSWTPAAAGYRPEVGFAAAACTAPGCPWYLALAPRSAVGAHVADAATVAGGGQTALSRATAAAVRRGVTDVGAIVDAVVGGRHLRYPSAAKRAALAACCLEPATMAALRTAVAEQVAGYLTLMAHDD